MLAYIAKRLILLPVTLFAIVLVNFLIINLAPGEPVYVAQIGPGGQASAHATETMVGPENQYLQFREFFGLRLPILYNDWPTTSRKQVLQDLETLRTKREEMSAKKYSKLRVLVGDRARYTLPQLLSIAQSPNINFETRKLALHFFLLGATRFTTKNRAENLEIEKENLFLDSLARVTPKNEEALSQQVAILSNWYKEHPVNCKSNLQIAFFDTRLARYLERVLTLDFGVMRNDPNQRVIHEVISRLKISLTLSILPMVVTFVLCQIIGMQMAIFSGSFFDRSFNLGFLILWSIPVFVVAPFLIEKVALNHNYPFTDIPFPISGFNSEESLYNQLTSWQRILDIARHITLPLITIFLGSMALQTRLTRAICIDVLSHDYVRTAKAKGAGPWMVYGKHVGRNAAIPIVTSVAGSLGVIIGGSVIIETIFEIHGFGKFFYDAILNRDYNVMMFSSLVGSFLALVGYLVADLSYMALDPRVELEAKQ